jgi:hypothetical protein
MSFHVSYRCRLGVGGVPGTMMTSVPFRHVLSPTKTDREGLPTWPKIAGQRFPTYPRNDLDVN